MKITIVGGGNVGTQFAAHCASKAHETTVYTSRPECFHEELTIIDENDSPIVSGCIKNVTNNPSEAFADAGAVFVTMPAYCMRDIAEVIYPYAGNGMMIGLIPGTGGGECAFKKCADAGATIFGIQRVPSVARLVEYGHIVRASGYRERLHAASLPKEGCPRIAQFLSDIFDMPCEPLPDYLNVTLTPSNQILHTARLRTMFWDCGKGTVYDYIPLFYEEWDDAASELLLACDAEVQDICRRLKGFDLSFVKSLREHYESDTPKALTRKMRSIESLRGLRTPSTRKPGGGYFPDLNSRYFKADFPYGLSIYVQLAELLDGEEAVEAVHLKETMQWYWDLTGKKEGFRFSDYGINDLDALTAYYGGRQFSLPPKKSVE